jgi:hypothetical protein
MTTVDGIEKAVAKLPPNELAAFRTWFEVLDAQRLDKAIERGAGSGKLDKLADEALAAHRAGRTREIGEMRQARHSGRPPIGCRKPCALAGRSYALLKADPRQPSLHFKRVGRY